MLNHGKAVYTTMILAVAALIVGFLSSGPAVNRDRLGGDYTLAGGEMLAANPAFALTGENAIIADIAEQSIESVVNIYSTRTIETRSESGQFPLNDDFFRRFFGPAPEVPQEREARGQGSGVIIDRNGTILTNNHVVQDATELKVTLFNEEEYDAEIVGTDPKSDLAVIRLKGDHNDLTPLELGDSDDIRLGEIVLAIGNPFGLSHTVTMGIVSAKARGNMGIVDYENFIQTDAAINPGNSGGALVNLEGELVGVNTAILSNTRGYQGVGFAIPANMAEVIKDKLIEDGEIIRGYLGVGIQRIDSGLADALDVSTRSGVLVTEVHDGTPAEKAGIEKGDIITAVNGEKISSPNQLRNEIAILGEDATVDLTVNRNGREIVVEAELTALPSPRQLAGPAGKGSADPEKTEDVAVAPLNDTARTRFRIPESIENGVVITGVKRNGPAHNAGLMPGDVVREAGNTTVETVDDFTNAYRNASGTVLLRVYRKGGHIFIAVEKQ